MLFLQISPLTDFAKLLTANMLQFLSKPEKSVKICWNLSESVMFADFRGEITPLSIRAKTGKPGRHQQDPYRTKSIVFAKKSLPDFVIISCPSSTYRNPESSFFRTFSHFFANLRKNGISSSIQKNTKGIIMETPLQLAINSGNSTRPP